MNNNKKSGHQLTVAVVGAGPVGALSACYFASHGHEVHLYEFRDDIRKTEQVPGRSINLALSHRGLTALQKLGMAETMMQHVIPLYARLIHNTDGTKRALPYGKGTQCINSIRRQDLIGLMLSEAEKFSNVHYHFKHKLMSASLGKGQMTFSTDNGDVKVNADLIVGCDGAYSSVRKQMLKRPMFNYSQEYIPHGYMELCMPPTPSGDFAMEVNYLHIWPRGKFMMTALPNHDRSFTCTLFLSFETFETFKCSETILSFFHTNFPDSIELLGKDNLVNTILSSKPFPLVSIKCHPYHVSDKSVILGDAAHAMGPFSGQGMNSGLEDCLILDEMLTQYEWDLSKALPAFSDYRNPDAEAIVDLAMYNYREMRDLVNSKIFILRKKLDNILHAVLPSVWFPLYTMMTFTRTRYHQVVIKKRRQDTIVNYTFWISIAGLSAIALLFSRQTLQHQTSRLLYRLGKFVIVGHMDNFCKLFLKK